MRATKDIDFWVGTDPSNAEKLLKVVHEFAGTTHGLSLNSFTQPDSIVFLGIEPFCLDLITTIAGVEFRDCLPKSVQMKLDGMDVQVIDFDSLIKNKMSTGRETDRMDVIKLSEQ